MPLGDNDALIAAPEHHDLVFENEWVRVLRTRILAGETVPLHSHEWPAVSTVMSWSNCVRRDETGAVTLDTEAAGFCPEPGTTMWMEPLPLHTMENVGEGEVLVISVEIKPQNG
ncbi:MAG TPA: hypothetical protein PKA27_14025 [Fimbriimonadaceae bacterium]|nr:hypothetical protein [Fimbriimonadaceae bacterium]